MGTTFGGGASSSAVWLQLCGHQKAARPPEPGGAAEVAQAKPGLGVQVQNQRGCVVARETICIMFEVEGDPRDIAAYREKLAADIEGRTGRMSRILDMIGKAAGEFHYCVVRSGTTIS